MIIQFTGLSGSGKTTIADGVKRKLEAEGIPVEVIDGDRYRQTICKDLGFSKEDRHENIRRLGNVAFAFDQKNFVAILAAINPYAEIRYELREKYHSKIVYLECNLSTLVERDTKGLYKRALLPDEHPDKLFHLTGISDPYDIPSDANLVLKTDIETIEQSVEKLYHFILDNLNNS